MLRTIADSSPTPGRLRRCVSKRTLPRQRCTTTRTKGCDERADSRDARIAVGGVPRDELVGGADPFHATVRLDCITYAEAVISCEQRGAQQRGSFNASGWQA